MSNDSFYCCAGVIGASIDETIGSTCEDGGFINTDTGAITVSASVDDVSITGSTSAITVCGNSIAPKSTESEGSNSAIVLRPFTNEEERFLLNASRQIGMGVKNKWESILCSFNDKFGSIPNMSIGAIKTRLHRFKKKISTRSTSIEESNQSIISNTGKKIACQSCKKRKRKCDGSAQECSLRKRIRVEGPLDAFTRAV